MIKLQNGRRFFTRINTDYPGISEVFFYQIDLGVPKLLRKCYWTDEDEWQSESLARVLEHAKEFISRSNGGMYE